ncbi:hypothetical protein [Rubinisphaera margarita]|uniref:hypothetical protein n=1 Tax=Rubinisphaera margarita TaxID=2909586 RepID=UPI001EE8908F|nr:hypothetical protein [Rubinisphaera margarita]MCG6155636.1 hypothetical protein [Rubinisphaera margarita]
MKRHVTLLALSLVSALVLNAVGCGGTQSAGATASGTVTVSGQPLTRGLVQLVPKGGGPSSFGTIQEDGSFQVATTAGVSGIEPGEYGAYIDYAVEDGESLPFHRKYTSEVDSGLTYTIQEDQDNVLAIELEGPDK